jgi:ribonuclease I
VKNKIAWVLAIVTAAMAGVSDGMARSKAPKIEVVRGEFDNYVFAVSYQTDFCLSHPNKVECQSDDILDGMGLHGLWPNRNDDPRNQYGYCDLSERQVSANWCAPEIDVKPKIDDKIYEKLSMAMPGVKSCLYNHEWYAHGSCSGLSVDDYFANASQLTFKFWKLETINDLIFNHEGQVVTRNDILNALEADLGPKARDAVVVSCRYDKRTQTGYLSEIRIALDKAKYMSFPAEDSLSQMKPRQGHGGTMVKDEGNCPEEIEISKLGD